MRSCGRSFDPTRNWRRYIDLAQAEECFRLTERDLHLRPVYHQTAARVEEHILVCFLTVDLCRTLEMKMKSKVLGDCARQLIKEVPTIRSMDVVLAARPADEVKAVELRPRVLARPDKMVAELLAHIGLEPP